MGGKPQWWDQFYGESWSLKALSKNFNLAIKGGLGWMKWLKNGAGKGFIFHAMIPALYSFWWNFIGSVKIPLYLVCLNLNHEKIK